MSKKKRIILHGHLADLHPDPIEVEGKTVAECIRALQQIPALTPANGQPHPIMIEGVNSDIALFAPTEMEEIHVYPHLGGAGGDINLMQILIGVALVTVGFAFAPVVAGIELGASMILTGGMMIVGGLLGMLTPMPEESKDEERSRILGANQNTVQIGTRIPLLYGTRKVGGHYLSFDVDAKDHAGVSKIPGVPTGTAKTVGDGIYVEHDHTPVDICPVNPIYTDPVASPTNIPTSAWSIS